ncbi:hypothetical protein OG554_32435 [Streptomyces griseus]|uniref:hypothetical protein n=1 Tax=Streptomyces griseus TaxID=1911 RepID=UPI00386B3291|nr:hypothetical protein OG554_32435 [Streptomyces fimicarius]
MTTEHGHELIDLAPYVDNAGCALPGIDTGPGFDGFGRAFPAEELDLLEEHEGLRTPGWGRGAPDNVACDGQRVLLPGPVPVRGIRLLGACSGGSILDEITVEGDGPDRGRSLALRVALSDFLAVRPYFGEEERAVCSLLREGGKDVRGPRPRLWSSGADLAEGLTSRSLRLPINPQIHIFRLSIVAGSGTRAR